MHMAPTRVWTLEDLDRLPDDDNRYELLHGDLFVTPPPEPDHETAIARLNRLLLPFVVEHGLGLIFMGHPAIRTSDSHAGPHRETATRTTVALGGRSRTNAHR